MMRRLVPFLAFSTLACFAAACGDDSGTSDPADAPTGGGPDGQAADAGNPPNYTTQSCGEGPPTDALPLPDGAETPDAVEVDAGETVDGGEAADAAPAADAGMSWPGLDEPCCDPTGPCSNGNVCLVSRDDQSHRCRPTCTPGGSPDECPQPSSCLLFSDGSGVCIPAGLEGDPCSPEFCASGLVCVGPNSDNAYCRSCCTDASMCGEAENCAPLNPPPAACPMACVPQ